MDLQCTTELKTLANIEYRPAITDVDLRSSQTMTIPLEQIANLGVAGQPVLSIIQNIFGSEGGSGIYFVNTHGKTMFRLHDGSGYCGNLPAANGGVGGGQASLNKLVCDPTMLFVAAAISSIEKKLDDIQEAQEDILTFLEQKEEANLRGNLSTLNEIAEHLKFNWNNSQYKNNKHILVQNIKREAEQSIQLFRSQLEAKMSKRTLLHTDQSVQKILHEAQSIFSNYDLALYLYAFCSYLEVMLLGEFSEGYINDIINKIEDYSYQYRELYSQGYAIMESYSASSVQTHLLKGLAAASRSVGKAIAATPVISKSQLDENLIATGGKIKKSSAKCNARTMEGFRELRRNTTLPFIENLGTIRDLYNKPVDYYIDRNNLYIKPLNI